MSLLANSNAIESGGYNIDRSLRFRGSASAYLSRTPASAGNRKTWTWSGWVKRSQLSVGRSIFVAETSFSQRLHFGFDPTDVISIYGEDGGVYVSGTTTAVFRDPSAFYHVVFAWDTTQSTTANRVKLFINGVQTALTLTTAPAQNTNGVINAAVSHFICAYPRATQYFDGLLTEVNFIDGQALTPSSFGQIDAVTGVWTPKKYTGTYGTNGFYLPFSDNTSATTLAYDKSGNGNNWTANNISTTSGATYDSMTDVPTLTSATAANFATINPVMTPQFAQTYYDGNLRCVGGYAYVNAQSTIAAPSGKWYAEAVFTAKASSELSVGINNKSVSNYIGNGGETGSCGYWTTGNKTINGASTAYGATYTINDIIGIAMDIDGGTVTFYKNGVSQGAISYTFSGSYGFLTGGGGAFAAGDTVVWNFGQRPFSYTPPTGFKALNTFNLPDPTIKKPNQYMDATTYTGTGVARSVTNAAGFQPDLVWVKCRSVSYSHLLTDSVRGATKRLISDTTAAEVTDTDTLTSFNVNGFSWGTGIGGNQNGATYVGWQWKKGATPGFDIVTWTCPTNNTAYTVNHSLGVAPKMMVLKARNNAAANWFVYHEAMGNTGYMALNLTNGNLGPYTPAWNNTSPTSTNFTAGTYWAQSAWTMVAYLFSEIPGFSKFGSYTGNGSADGPFVYCGFRPKYVMVKRTDTTENWYVHDSSRDTYNQVNTVLYPNLSNAEGASNANMDFTSNGFKIRENGTASNGSGGTYIYAAFAENPFKYSLAR